MNGKRIITAWLCLCLFIMAGWPLSSFAHAPASGDVTVSVRLMPPFVERQGDSFTGFSADLWNEIARRHHWTTHFIMAPNVETQLNAMSAGAADVGVGAISITADRDLKYDFSQPILNSGLQILVRTQHSNPESTAFESLMHLLFSPAVLVWLGIAALLTVIPAHIVWFAERSHPEGMIPSKAYFPGIFQAFFWGLGTLATQADSMPRHWISRIVAVLWMFTSVVFVAFYTATLTASLTVQQFRNEINGPGDLPGKAVASVQGTTSAEYLQRNGIKANLYPTADDAFNALTTKKVDAVVFDAPVLQYLSLHGASPTNVTGPVFEEENYGFAFRNNSGLRRQVDATLLQMREDGTYQMLSDRWFGKK